MRSWVMTSLTGAARQIIGRHRPHPTAVPPLGAVADAGTVAGGTAPDGAAADDGAEVAPSSDGARLEVPLREVGASLQQALESIDPPLSAAQMRCLFVLDGHDGTTIGDMAAAAGIAPSTASRLAHRLVSAALVDRRGQRGDRRQVTLTLTERGRAMLAEILRVRAGALQPTLERMADDDRAALLRGALAFAAARAEQLPPEVPAAGQG